MVDKITIPDPESNLGLRVAVLEMVVQALVKARENPDGPVPIPFDEETVSEYQRVYGSGSWEQVCDYLEFQYGLPVVNRRRTHDHD